MSRLGPFSRVLAVSVALTLCAAVLLFAAAALAQQPATQNSTNSRVAANKVALKKFVDAVNRLSPEVRRHLSRGLQNYLHYANAVVNGGALAGNLSTANFASKNAKSNWNPWNMIPVSSPALDPATQGYTQNTTSSAWCGNTMVVGYEDSGALFRSDPNGAFGVPTSVNGVSYSDNGGKTFTDLGLLTPGTSSGNALLGDPAVTCSSPAHFQYASLMTTTLDNVTWFIGPAVSFSANEGRSWSEPQQVVGLGSDQQMVDSPWLAVDPTDSQRLYLSYTEMDFLGAACNGIDMISSFDGGKKWNPPIVIDQECPPTDPTAIQNTVAGSSITVGSDGEVYVAYEFFPGALPSGPLNNEIKFASSRNHGGAFSKPLRVANLVPNGTGTELCGHLQVYEYPHIAVDRSHGPSRGTIYVAYPDGRNKITADANCTGGTYAYPDIFVAKSINSGRTFSVLGAISPTPKDFGGIGRDQFLPGVAVDKDGDVAVCYYDRRNDPADMRVDRFCSVSSNQGKTWTDRQVSNLQWLPSLNRDPLDPGYGISEYDALTSEFLLHGDGFFGAFLVEISGNQNVVATKF